MDLERRDVLKLAAMAAATALLHGQEPTAAPARWTTA